MKAHQSKCITGTVQTPEHIAKRKATYMKRIAEDPTYGRGMLNKKHTAESLKKMSIAQTGVPKSKEHIAKMRKRPQDVDQLTCPHCVKVGDYEKMAHGTM